MAGNNLPSCRLRVFFLLGTIIVLFSLSVLGSLHTASAHSGDSITVPFSATSVTVDGQLNPSEWDDAAHLSGVLGSNSDFYIKYLVNQQDIAIGLNLFEVSLSFSPNSVVFIFIDFNHDASSSPQSDDYYFYMYADGLSGVYQGTGTTWTSSVYPSGWIPNVRFQNYNSEYGFELLIPKVLTPGQTIGISIGYYDWNNGNYIVTLWPYAEDYTRPYTWADATFQKQTTTVGITTPTFRNLVHSELALEARVSPSVSSGTVSFYHCQGPSNCNLIGSTTPSNGIANFYWAPSTAQTYYFTATYSGNQVYQSSSSSIIDVEVDARLSINAHFPNQNIVTVDASTYTTDSNGIVVLTVPGGTYSVGVAPVLSFTSGTRYVFDGWNTGSTQDPLSVFVQDNTNLDAIYETQYYLNVASSYGTVSGSDWYKADNSASFSVDSQVDQGNQTKRLFLVWRGDTTTSTSSGSILMDSPKNITAIWKTQYSLKVVSPYGSVKGSGWYDKGSTATFSVDSSVDQGNMTRRLFTGWTGDSSDKAPSSALVMNAPKVVAANWKTEYPVFVLSGGGEVNGGGWFEAGSQVAIQAQSPSNENPNVSRLVFLGWIGTVNSESTQVQFVVDKPYNLSATWKKQFYVTATSEMGHVNGSGWYDAGSRAAIQVDPVSFGYVIQQVFTGWTGDETGSSASITFVADGPKGIHATWRNDYTQLFIIVGVLAVAGVGGVFARSRMKKRPEAEAEAIPASTGHPMETGTSVYTSVSCPSCGFANPSEGVYCGNCGAALGSQKN